jgi:hypothetical protein
MPARFVQALVNDRIMVMGLAGSAVAVTSLALMSVLRQAVSAIVPPVDVILGLPRTSAIDTGPSVGLHLFRVDAAASRTAALPRRPAAATKTGPRTWELDYVVSFGGDNGGVVAQLMLGLVVEALEATPVVSANDGIVAFQTLHPDLPAPNAIESIRVAPLAMAGGDRAALWSMLSTPYQLSVEYRAQLQTN